jgi:prepilin-type processing-associated H-X9-DG protein
VAEGYTHVHFHTWKLATNAEASGDGLVYPHRDKCNVLFADGHVGSFTQEQIKDHWDLWYDRAIDG